MQRVIAAVLHPIGNLFAGVVDYGGALSENQRLQLEVGQLRRQLIESQQAQEQLDQLRADQNLPFADGIPEVLGQVISSPSSNFDLTIEIDRGTSNGVGVGMPVVSGAGLVGSVISAGPQHGGGAAADRPRIGRRGPIRDRERRCRRRARVRAIPLQLQDVSEASRTHRGAPVVTSGLDTAAYPSGIPVGTVASVRHSGGSLTTQVLVTPIVNLSVLQYVAVLQWLAPA